MKNMYLHPFPSTVKKKKENKSKCTLSPIAQWIKYKPLPFSRVKSDCLKLQGVKKVTKSHKNLTPFNSKK
jgi:hypothetical protein